MPILSMRKTASAPPSGKVDVLGHAVCETAPAQYIPLYLDAISAGFPSPADDYVENALDLNEYLVKNPAATFMVRVSGDSMIDAGIHDNDVLIVDRSRNPVPGTIVVAVLDGELTVKRLKRHRERFILFPENSAYAPIVVGEEQELSVWGVVSGVVRKL